METPGVNKAMKSNSGPVGRQVVHGRAVKRLLAIVCVLVLACGAAAQEIAAVPQHADGIY